MRNNQPVTGIECPYPSGRVIISRTDVKGRMTGCDRDEAKIRTFDS